MRKITDVYTNKGVEIYEKIDAEIEARTESFKVQGHEVTQYAKDSWRKELEDWYELEDYRKED